MNGPTREEIAQAIPAMKVERLSSLIYDTMEVLRAIVEMVPQGHIRSAARALHERLSFEFERVLPPFTEPPKH